MGESNARIAELIEGARRGRPGAMGELLGAYRGYLRNVARRALDKALRSKVDSSDMVQEALTEAYKDFRHFRGQTEEELSAWLKQILAHQVSDLVRRYCQTAARRVSLERSLDEAVDRSHKTSGDFVATGDVSPCGCAARRELALALADALSVLAPDHRDVIVLRSIRELEWADVAREMGRSPDAARMLHRRALEVLRPLIQTRL